jgi:hypothetical protein
MPTLLVATTTYKQSMHPQAAYGLARAIGGLQAYNAKLLIQGKEPWNVEFPPLTVYDGLGVDTRRNEVIRHAKGEGCDAVFFVDADTEITRRTIVDLLVTGKPLITGLVAARGEPTTWVVRHLGHKLYLTVPSLANLKATGKPVVQGGGEPPICAGAACLLIHREVWEQTPPPWFERTEEDDCGKGMTGDLYFWEKAATWGVLGWAHLGVRCKHWDGRTCWPKEGKHLDAPLPTVAPPV